MATSILGNIILLYLFIFTGFVLGLILKSKKEQFTKLLNHLIIDIFTPLLIFLIMLSTDIQLDSLSIVEIMLLEVGSVLFNWTTTILILPRYIEDRKQVGAFMFLNGFPNVMIYGIPIVLAVYNVDLLIIPIIFSIASLTMRGFFGNIIGEKFGANINLSFKESLKRLLLFPPLIGIIISIIFLPLKSILPVEYFAAFKSAISPIYSALGGIIIGSILSKLNFPKIKQNLRNIGFVSVWRFGFSLIYFLSVIFFLKFPQEQTAIRTLLCIAVIGPPAVINVAFSNYFGLDDELAAISVATITLIALALLPAILYLGNLYL
ncbi:MAG: AEC family transporter [Promethearchaeota archaeon]